MRVYPIGYEQDVSGARLAELMHDYSVHLIDCRFNPYSWRNAWCKAFLMDKWGERYHWAGPWLGNAKHPTNQAFPGLIEIELIDPRRGVAGLLHYLRQGNDLILLCKCMEYRYCHLHEVVRCLVQAMPEVEIILPEKPQIDMPTKGHVRPGAKVTAKIKGKSVPALVVRTGFGSEGDYLMTWIKIAQRNELNEGAWMISEYGPIQSNRLTKRYDVVPGLDDLES